jgi:hypothetical protein
MGNPPCCPCRGGLESPFSCPLITTFSLYQVLLILLPGSLLIWSSSQFCHSCLNPNVCWQHLTPALANAQTSQCTFKLFKIRMAEIGQVQWPHLLSQGLGSRDKGSVVQSRPPLYNGFKVSLGCRRSCHKNKNKPGGGGAHL